MSMIRRFARYLARLAEAANHEQQRNPVAYFTAPDENEMRFSRTDVLRHYY